MGAGCFAAVVRDKIRAVYIIKQGKRREQMDRTCPSSLHFNRLQLGNV